MLNTEHRPAACETHPCDGAVRNHYFPKKLMSATGFRLEQDYLIERRRMLNRALHGWGVVGGLDVALTPEGRLQVSPGVALDRHGREIVLTASQTISWCDVIVEVDGRLRPPGRKPQIGPGHWQLRVHYAERGADRTRTPGDCGACEDAWNLTCETLVFTLVQTECSCGDPGPPDDCGCVQDGCFRPGAHLVEEPPPDAPKATPAPSTETPARTARGKAARAAQRSSDSRALVPVDTTEPLTPTPPPYPRGPHAVLCCWSKHAEVLEDEGRLCDCCGVQMDAGDGVPLACFTVEQPSAVNDPTAKYPDQTQPCPPHDGCDPEVGDVDPCTCRRFVKRTDMLFDLIRGCDLTRIVRLSWAHFAEQGWTEWPQFQALFHPSGERQGGPAGEVPTGFIVEFSGPVQAQTLTPLAVSMMGYFSEPRAGWLQPLRVPVVRIQTAKGPHDPPGTARWASLVVDWTWWNDQVDRPRVSEFTDDFEDRRRLPIYEILIDGNRILDCRGQPVAAGGFGPGATPSGNGLPGGVCRTSFRIAPADSGQAAARTLKG